MPRPLRAKQDLLHIMTSRWCPCASHLDDGLRLGGCRVTRQGGGEVLCSVVGPQCELFPSPLHSFGQIVCLLSTNHSTILQVITHFNSTSTPLTVGHASNVLVGGSCLTTPQVGSTLHSPSFTASIPIFFRLSISSLYSFTHCQIIMRRPRKNYIIDMARYP